MSSDPIEAQLDAYRPRFIRLLWCDNANQIRAKAFHVSQLDAHRDHGIGISVAQQAVTALVDAPAPGSGLGPVGEVWLRPDWSTLTPIPYTQGHVRVMADIVTREGPWSCCPRDFLRRCVAALAAEGLTAQAAFEHEFTLLRPGPDGSLAPADSAPFAATAAMDTAAPVIDGIVDSLERQAVPVLRYYPESGPGQHEISVNHGEPMAAADRAVILRETVHAIAQQHGLVGSFLPKILPEAAGNGCHLHLSLWREGRNLLPGESGQLSEVGLHFVAGILHHLPGLMAVTTPSPNSFRRLLPHTWSGAFHSWGYDNREAAIRVPSEPAGATPTHLEVKTVDASANPYLALGAVLTAGLDGIRRRLTPPVPLTVDPADVPGTPRLPSGLPHAIAALEDDTVLLDALGPDLATAFLAVRREEARLLTDASLADEVAAMAHRY